MHITRRTGLLGLITMGIMVLASCGSSGAYGYGPSSNATNPTATTSAAGVTIKTHTASVGGSTKTVLADAGGMTLYYFDPDTTQSVACSGACANTWPPLAAGGGKPTADTTLPGSLSVLDGANGKQVEYNGHPLYTYSGDSSAGQAKGDGIGGKWHAATPDTTLNSNTGAPTPSY
jgi:predicted lipoprotein with Yx(FWY)xxD motif